ncbi:MAG TPA: SRPBCC family protein [Acidimicrobiia bacterium]|nr:SRPBCC family protein [Acidimicrobiia bacterium]
MTTSLQTRFSIEIDRPAETVWAVVSDYPNDLRWRKGITEMSADRPGAPAVGTRVREVLQLGGREYVTETQVTEAGPGMRYRFAGTGTSGAVEGGRSVEPGAHATSSVFHYDVEVRPDSISPVVRPVLRWWLGHSMRRDLRALRALVETRS